LRERGEVVTAVKVDGNSLARALAHQLAGSEEQHSRIRAVIAQSFAKVCYTLVDNKSSKKNKN